MKKSLMLVSFAFIFLLSVSFVSANFFDWITGDASTGKAGEAPTRITEGKTATIGDLNVEVVSVKEGVAKIEVNGENIEVREGDTKVLSDGTKLNILEASSGRLFRKASTKITVDSSLAVKEITSVCYKLVEGATTTLTRGVKSNVNGHDILIIGDKIEIDNQFSSSLPSGIIEVPIPVGFWVVTLNPDGTYTFTTKALAKKCKSDKDCPEGKKCDLKTGLCKTPCSEEKPCALGTVCGPTGFCG